MIKYFKTLWENNITPVNGRNLNKIEDALEYLYDVIRNVPSEENIRIANEKQRQQDETTRSNSEVKRNATFDSKIKDVDKAINASNENIKEVNNKFEMITASKQQDAEIIIARDGEISLNARIERDVKKGKLIEETKTGEYLTFDDTVDSIISSIELHGNTIQNPNTLEIKSAGIDNGDGTYKMSILSCGENLLKPVFKLGNLSLNNADNTRGHSVFPVKVLSNSNISINVPNGYGVMISKVDVNNIYISNLSSGYLQNNHTVNVGDSKFIGIQFKRNDNAILSESEFQNLNIKLQEGTVATPYAPYQETRCDIKLPCQLEKWDKLYFDKEENAWCVDKVNTTKKYNGAENWIMSFVGDNIITLKLDVSDYVPSNNTSNNLCDLICDRFKIGSPAGRFNDTPQVTIASWGDITQLFVNISLSELTTPNATGGKQWICANNILVKHKTITPQKIVLPQSEQIKLNSFANKTYIYTVSGDVDATVKATVSKSLASTVQANTEEISKINNTIEDIQGLKESQDFAYETDKGYLICKDTQNGVVKDLKVYGRTKLVNAEGIEVEPGTDGATLISVGNGNEIEVLSRSIDIKKIIRESNTTPQIEIFLEPIFTNNNVYNGLDKEVRLTVFLNNSWVRDIVVKPESYIYTNLKQGEYINSIVGYKSLGHNDVKSLYKLIIFEKQDKKPILFKDTDGNWKPVINLRGIDENNCDIVDSVNNVFENNILEFIINGTESNISQNNTYPPENTNLMRFDLNVSYGAINILCDKLKVLDVSNQGIEEGIRPHANKNMITIFISKSKLESQDLAGFKKWLQVNNIKVLCKLITPNKYEVNPLNLQSFENETMISIGSGAIAPHASWKITSSLPNFVQNIEDRVCRLENDAYKVNLANFAVALNMLDMKARLESLEAPIN